MAPRDLKTLMFDHETPETIRSALDALDELKPTTAKHGADILRMREDLLRELHTLEGQGSLF